MMTKTELLLSNMQVLELITTLCIFYASLLSCDKFAMEQSSSLKNMPMYVHTHSDTHTRTKKHINKKAP